MAFRTASRWSALRLSVTAILAAAVIPATAFAATQQSSGSIGIQGTIPSSAPTQAPTITAPSSGQTFSNLPINVSGLCQNGLLVEVFKNAVFAGSRECSGSSYTVQIDLFSGRNDLIARDYDSLNQSSPDSNTVTVTFNNSLPETGPLISLTTQYAKRGADPGSVLTWPISLSGGNGPYAISVDWGDKSTPDLISQKTPGNINLQHTYDTAGVYNITIQATDINGETAFLQVVGVGNGPIQQTNQTSSKTTIKTVKIVPWWAIAILFALTFISFWLGNRHRLQTIRVRLRKGEPPFG